MTTLTDLIVLALDCQTTGATPEKGRLLEIGWIAGRAGGPIHPKPSTVHSHLIRMAPPTEIPKAVQKVTGITDSIMGDALEEADVWQQLHRTATHIAARNDMTRCPTVIHYARFEQPFLNALHHTHNPQSNFPFQIICTHAIAARLLPELPRRGLRALAGFFGQTLPEQRRSDGHAGATMLIWQKLVVLLASRHNVETPAQLERWLATPATKRTVKRTFPMKPDRRRHLPDLPGVYRMRSVKGDLLYVGKATSLKKRVNSYFRPKATHAEHILEMLTQAREVDVTPTHSALEAAVLEADEIKHWSPPYNRALRDQGQPTLFFSRDLTRYTPTADNRYCLGPFPENRSGDSLAAFGAWIAGGMPSDEDGLEAASAMLPFFQDRVPDEGCLTEGLALFVDHYGQTLTTAPATRVLHRLGIRFWEEQRQASAAQGEADGEAPFEDDLSTDLSEAPNDPEYQWAPEDIEKAIKSHIRHWAHLLRRARWLCLLSESSLAWSTIDPSDDLNLIIVAKGEIREKSILAHGDVLPVPPGYGCSRMKRQENLDRMTYDRLRVMTTELRRLVAQGRDVRIRFHRRGVLTGGSLKRLMEWI